MWTMDPANLPNEYPLTAGVMILNRVRAAVNDTWSTLYAMVTGNGSGSPTGFNGMAIFDDGGTLLKKSTDSITPWTSGAAGGHAFPLSSSQAVVAGTHYWIGILYNGDGTRPTLGSTAGALNDNVINYGSRRSVYLTGQSDFPASVDTATMSLNNAIHWLAAS